VSHVNAFVVRNPPQVLGSTIPSCRVSLSSLDAKKKKKRSESAGQGFGSSTAPETINTTKQNDSPPAVKMMDSRSNSNDSSEGGLSPVVNFSSDDLSTEDRNKEILKGKFGLRSFEEQQGDFKAAEQIAKNKSRMQKFKDMKDEEFDIFQVVPPNILTGIDLFLKTGLAITTTLFILSGFAITAEAWSAATHNELPPNVDEFIVNTVEPNFTIGLLVLLGFSVSLGIFASAQLGSSSSIYTED